MTGNVTPLAVVAIMNSLAGRPAPRDYLTIAHSMALVLRRSLCPTPSRSLTIAHGHMTVTGNDTDEPIGGAGHRAQAESFGEMTETAVPSRTARNAGLFLIFTALVTLIAVAGRVAADADRDTVQETLAAIADSRFPYAISGAGRLASGITLTVAALYLYRTWIIRQRLVTPIVPGILALSGLLTTISGLLAIVLAIALPGGEESADGFYEVISGARWLTGVAGFSAVGLALIVASPYQHRIGGMLRAIAPVSAVLGAVMQLIWIQDFTALHRLSGMVFFVWLIAIGLMLMSGRAERQFRSWISDGDARFAGD